MGDLAEAKHRRERKECTLKHGYLRLLEYDPPGDERARWAAAKTGRMSELKPKLVVLRAIVTGVDARRVCVCYLAGCLAVSSASRRLPSSVNTKRPPRVRLINPIDISNSRASLDKNLASPLATRRSELTSAELSEVFGLRRRMMRHLTPLREIHCNGAVTSL